MTSSDNQWMKAFSLTLSFRYIRADVYYRSTSSGVQVMFRDDESVSLAYDDVSCRLLKAYIELTGPVSLISDVRHDEITEKILLSTFPARELKSLIKE